MTSFQAIQDTSANLTSLLSVLQLNFLLVQTNRPKLIPPLNPIKIHRTQINIWSFEKSQNLCRNSFCYIRLNIVGDNILLIDYTASKIKVFLLTFLFHL